MRQLLDRYDQQELNAIIDLYSKAYGDSGLTAEKVLEEILCDAMGNMNAFATEATERIAGEVGVFLRDVEKAAKRKGGQKKNATGDGGVKKSRNVGRNGAKNTRMAIYGSVKGKNGLPMMVVFDIRPLENHLVIDDMQKVASAYTKTNDGVSFVKNSFMMYADEKRATSLLRSIGFQMPIELLQSGYIGSITYKQRSVNLYGENFSDVFGQNSTENQYSREMDTQKALERQVELLKGKVEYWKEQTRTRKNIGKKADAAEVRKLGRKLLREYSSDTSLEEILPELRKYL